MNVTCTNTDTLVIIFVATTAALTTTMLQNNWGTRRSGQMLASECQDGRGESSKSCTKSM
jgi:hypothetical protein